MKNLKEKLTQWRLKKIQKKQLSKSNFIDYRKELTEARKVLFLIPDEKTEYTEFNDFLTRLKKLFPALKTYYLMVENHPAGIIERGALIFSYNKNDSNFLDLYKKEFISKLKKESFDMIFDLNKDFHTNTSYILLSLDVPLKITFYDDSPIGCSSLCVKPEGEDTEQKRFDVLLKYLSILSS
ncbi:hypothetical protein ACFL4T_05855 [candidate division KSB1 bacterium]